MLTVALGHVLLQLLRFSPVSIIRLLLHGLIHSPIADDSPEIMACINKTVINLDKMMTGKLQIVKDLAGSGRGLI